MNNSKRVLYLDIIRIMACVMIVAMHAPIPDTGLDSYVLLADSLLTAPCIGMFIMVSGALLLPVSMPTKDFLQKRLGKVVAPTLVWVVIYWYVAPWTETVCRGDGMKLVIYSFLCIVQWCAMVYVYAYRTVSAGSNSFGMARQGQ